MNEPIDTDRRSASDVQHEMLARLALLDERLVMLTEQAAARNGRIEALESWREDHSDWSIAGRVALQDQINAVPGLVREALGSEFGVQMARYRAREQEQEDLRLGRAIRGLATRKRIWTVIGGGLTLLMSPPLVWRLIDWVLGL